MNKDDDDTAGTEDLGRTGSALYVGAFPGREIPRARVPNGIDSYSPGRVLILYIGQFCYDNPAKVPTLRRCSPWLMEPIKHNFYH